MKQRTRTRTPSAYGGVNALKVQWNGSVWADDLIPLQYPIATVNSEGETLHHESIVDEIGGERGDFKEVTHFKSIGVYRDLDVGVIEPLLNPAFQGRGVLGVPTSYLVTQTPGWRPIGYPYKKDSIYQLFSSSQLEQEISLDRDPFDTGFSFWFLLVDLVQLSGLFKQLIGPKSAVRTMFSLTRKYPNETARKLCDSHLATEFGLLPTISDMSSAAGILTSWQKKYAETNELLQKSFSYKHKTDLSPAVRSHKPRVETVFVDALGYGIFPVLCPIEISTRTEITHCSDLDYRFACPEFQGWRSRLKQFVDAFGVLDPAALWDIIPFSFVVDWFYHVGTWLHRNRPRLFPANVQCEQYCESIKVHVERTYRFRGQVIWDRFHDPVDYSPRIAYEQFDAYLRRRFQPPAVRLSGSLKKDASSLFVNLNRVALSASLLGQRVNPRGPFR